MSHFLSVALLLQAAAPVPADSHVVSLPRVETEAVVDGLLDEPVWAQASVLSGFRQYQPVDGRPAEERTEVRVWYAPDAIWFGIVAHDRQPGSVRATNADRDNIGSDDNVTIYLDTFNDRRRAFFFGVNPLGVQDDGVRSEGGFTPGSLQAGNVDRSPDYIYQSRGRITDSGYVVEVRIPFKSLRYPGGNAQRWGLNVVRVTQRTGYTDTWTDARRANASFLAQSGAVTGLHDLRRGLVSEIQPFVTASANGARDAGGAFSREEIDPSAGVNVRFGLTNLALDGTINPDFSQVEADEGVVTVNERFALFFNERRPFFLEGIELFSTPNRLVYTRRIVDPIAGAKLTGKFGRFGVAHLTAGDDVGTPGTAGSADALFNITRIRADLGTNSLAGLTYTDRIQGDAYNRVVAGDARIVFGRLYYVQGQLGRSWTRDGAGTRAGEVWQAEFDRTGRGWGFNYRLEGFGDDFESQSGFVPRVGIVRGSAFNRLTWYGSRGALLETFQTFFGVNRTWRYDGFLGEGGIEGDEQLNGSFRLRGGWSIDPRVTRGFVVLDPLDYAGYSTGGPVPGGFTPRAEITSAFRASIDVRTPTYRSFNAGVNFARGELAIFPEASEGNETRVTGSISLRPATSIRSQLSLTYSKITRDRDGSEFARTLIPRVRFEYQPTRALFFRFIGEYQAERVAALRDETSGVPLLIDGQLQAASDANGFSTEWLASYEPTPGTVAFLGYGSLLEDAGTLRFADIRRRSDGFFLKVSYLLRR